MVRTGLEKGLENDLCPLKSAWIKGQFASSKRMSGVFDTRDKL